MNRLLAAELDKVRTTRVVWVLLGTALAIVCLAVAGTLATADSTGLDLTSALGVRTVLHSAGSGAALTLVLGVTMTAGEFRQRTVTDTYLGTPRRGRVIVAKLLVATLVGIGFGVLAATAALAVAAPWLAAEDAALSASDPEVWRTLLGAVGWTALYGAIGVAVGALIRNLVGAIVLALAWVFLVEGLMIALLDDLGRWLPAAASASLGRAPDPDLLPQAGGGAVLAAYVAVLAALAVLTTVRRDVT